MGLISRVSSRTYRDKIKNMLTCDACGVELDDLEKFIAHLSQVHLGEKLEPKASGESATRGPIRVSNRIRTRSAKTQILGAGIKVGKTASVSLKRKHENISKPTVRKLVSKVVVKTVPCKPPSTGSDCERFLQNLTTLCGNADLASFRSGLINSDEDNGKSTPSPLEEGSGYNYDEASKAIYDKLKGGKKVAKILTPDGSSLRKFIPSGTDPEKNMCELPTVADKIIGLTTTRKLVVPGAPFPYNTCRGRTSGKESSKPVKLPDTENHEINLPTLPTLTSPPNSSLPPKVVPLITSSTSKIRHLKTCSVIRVRGVGVASVARPKIKVLAGIKLGAGLSKKSKNPSSLVVLD